MADVGLFIKNADIQARAGINANATAKAIAETDKYVLDIEAEIDAETRYDWGTNYGSLTAAVKVLLKEAGACLCAVRVIQQDTSGFASLEEASFMCDVLWTQAQKAIGLLRDQDVKTFLGGT